MSKSLHIKKWLIGEPLPTWRSSSDRPKLIPGYIYFYHGFWSFVNTIHICFYDPEEWVLEVTKWHNQHVWWIVMAYWAMKWWEEFLHLIFRSVDGDLISLSNEPNLYIYILYIQYIYIYPLYKYIVISYIYISNINIYIYISIIKKI